MTAAAAGQDVVERATTRWLNVARLADRGDDPNCEKHGFVTHRFLRVDTEKYDDYTFTIND